jgi:hypothetical protein
MSHRSRECAFGGDIRDAPHFASLVRTASRNPHRMLELGHRAPAIRTVTILAGSCQMQSPCNLAGADLRRSSFVDCVFENAVMKGVALARQQGSTMRLSEIQWSEIDCRDENAPAPGGG